MNRMYPIFSIILGTVALLFIFLQSHSLSGAKLGLGSKKVEVEFAYETRLGFKGMRRLKMQGEKFFIDGKPLESNRIVTGHSHLARIMNTNYVVDSSTCFAGFFHHQISVTLSGQKNTAKPKTTNQTRRGCLTDAAFGEINHAFSALR